MAIRRSFDREMLREAAAALAASATDPGSRTEIRTVSVITKPFEKGPVEIAPGCFRPSAMAWQGKGRPAPAVF